MAQTLKVNIVGDSSSLSRALGGASKSTSKLGRALGIGLRGAAVGAGAAFVGLGIAAKIGFDEFSDNQRVLAQTNAVLKSTGKAANVTAKHVDELAEAISGYSGADDEAIQAGENMLLTFTQIRNRVGKNNDIFDQATKTTTDLSVAMGIDMPKAALQIGKALNDPARGYARLQRIGVAFTEGQVKQIKAMSEAGDVAGAQKVILKELQKEFGGSAKAAGKTLPGQLNILKETMRNALGAGMAALLPLMTLFAAWAVKHMPQLRKATSRAFNAVVSAIQTVIDIGQELLAFYREHTALVQFLAGAVAGLTAGILLIAAATKAWAIAQVLLNIAMSLNPLAIVVLTIAALAGLLVVAYTRSEKFRDIVNAAFHAVQAVVGAVVGFIKDHWMLLLAVLLGPFGVVVGQIIKHWGTVKAVAVAAFDFIKDHWKLILGIMTGGLSVAAGKIVDHWNTIKNVGRAAFDGVSSAIRSVIGWIKKAIGWVQNLIDKINAIPHPSLPGGGGGQPTAPGPLGGGGGQLDRFMVPSGGGGGVVARAAFGGGFGGTVVVPVYLGEKEVYRATKTVGAAEKRRNGR